MMGSRSLSSIFYEFVGSPYSNEPFWKTYLWLFRALIGTHTQMFSFSNYFIIFLLTAYLGKVVTEKRFVVIILCTIFVNPGFLNNIFQVWRHTFALLLFLIGIFLFETNKRRLFSRSFLYGSILFHFVTLPLVILYEFFTLCATKNSRSKRSNLPQAIKWYSAEVVAYVIFFAVILGIGSKYGQHLSEVARVPILYEKYSIESGATKFGYNLLFHYLSCLIIFYFWFNRKQISKNDLFIGINYFLFVFAIMIADVPSAPMGRIIYVLLVGVSVLVGKLMLTSYSIGFGFILVMIFYRLHILSSKGKAGVLSELLGGEFTDPARGLLWMAYNYASILMN